MESRSEGSVASGRGGAWANRSEQIDALSQALVVALGEMQDLIKTETADAGKYKYTYATLASALQMARPVLSRHGLALTQVAESSNREVAIWTTILHSSGQYVTVVPMRLPAGDTAQATGSAVSFAKRYALMAVLGLATEDDDGASAAPRTPREAPRSVSERRTPSKPAARASEPRSDAEREIRALLATLTGPEATRVKAEFKAAFGSTLAELDTDLHEPALLWMREAVQVMNDADAAWVQEASA